MSSKEEAQARVGTTLEQRWRLEALIGYGSIAATYRARHRNGLEAAIKIIHRSHCEFESVVQRFLEEAHLANRIDHPGVERVFDDGVTDDGCVFLVLELLEGETLELRRMSMGGRLRLGEARPIVDGLLDALVAVHAANVLHRNLKPGNVFLTKDGRVVLTDFGRARLADEGPRSALPTDELVIGSPAFMAPEQALVAGPRSLRAPRNRPEVDARSDIWSAGAIIFTLLTGRRVHEGTTPEEKLENARTKAAPPLASVLIGANKQVAEVVDRALAFEKEARWPSASEMRRAWWLATGRDASSLPPDVTPGVRTPMPRPPTPPGGWETVAWPDEAERRTAGAKPSAADAAPDVRPPLDLAPRDSDPLPDLGPPPVEAFVKQQASPLDAGRDRRLRLVAVSTVLVLVALGLAILALTWSPLGR